MRGSGTREGSGTPSPQASGAMSVLVWLLILLALLLGAVGLLTLTQATMGAGMIAAACLAGILARIAQAAGHQRNIIREIRGQPTNAQPGPSPRQPPPIMNS